MILPIQGTVDREMAETIRLAVESKPDQIHLVLDSPGGGADAARRIYHRLRHSGVPVSAHVVRRCESAAVLILLAADRRTASPNAKFTLHETAHESSLRLTATNIEKLVPELRDIDEHYRSIVVDRTGCDPQWLEQEERTEDDLPIADAVRHGFIQEIRNG